MATPSIPQSSIFADGVLEPLRGLVAFTVAGNAIAANVTTRAFVDGIGQNAAGGLALVDGDYSLQGGMVPSGIGYEVHALSAWIHLTTYTAVPTDPMINALGSLVHLELQYAGQDYDLGMLGEYLGPWGSPVGLNNVQFPRRFGWPWMRESRPLALDPGKSFWLTARTIRAVAAGLTDGTYVIRFVLPARKFVQGPAAIKS